MYCGGVYIIVNLFGHGSSDRSLDRRESTVYHSKFAKYLHLLKLVLYCQTSLTRNSVDSTTCYTWTWAWVWLEFHVKIYFILSPPIYKHLAGSNQ